MTDWTIRLRGACFRVAEFFAATTLIIGTVTVVKYAL
jgi:hypothetical protein